MDDRVTRPSRGARGPQAPGLARERLVAWVGVLADEAYAEALHEWACTDEGPMPTLADARADAEEQARLLLEGLGEWGALPPELLDVQQDEVTRASRRQHRRNAQLRREGGHPFLDGWDF